VVVTTILRGAVAGTHRIWSWLAKHPCWSHRGRTRGLLHI